MPQDEEKPIAELSFARDDWERLVSSLERLMALQRKTLQRLKELSRRNEELSRKLRKAASAPTASRSKPVLQHRIELTGQLRTARTEPEREVTVIGLKCSCGRELASGAKFCDRCGRSV
jgi:dsDNA-specific endonuclease/ATPase MutS2